ncbi:MAG: hypothetical protein D6679_02985 [Candidatus Hydrogenedentota bacterium]|nr:MAG: hypothetical protein D6679_02985 [Candidatus Hydrogenedentota bacterium]
MFLKDAFPGNEPGGSIGREKFPKRGYRGEKKKVRKMLTRGTKFAENQGNLPAWGREKLFTVGEDV